MAALEFVLTSTDTTLAAATAKTVLQVIAPSTNKIRIKPGLEVSFDDTVSTDKPVLVQIMRQTTAIGGSPTTVTPVKKRNGDAGTLQVTAKKSAGGSEPTSSDIYWSGRLHPQGRHVIPQEFIVEQSDRLGVVCTSDVATPDVTVRAEGEE